MWRTRREMQKKIKQTQKEMHTLARKRGFNHPEVYSKSCELDVLIVEYMKKYKNYVNDTLFKNIQ